MRKFLSVIRNRKNVERTHLFLTEMSTMCTHKYV